MKMTKIVGILVLAAALTGIAVKHLSSKAKASYFDPAADKLRLADVTLAVRRYLAWKSIYDERETLNLDTFQTNQAKTKMDDSDQSIDACIPEAYQWLLVPTQPAPTDAIQWQQHRLQGQDVLSVRAARKLIGEELLIPEYSGVRLRMDLDRVPLWREDGAHVQVKQLCEDVAQYLPS